MVRAVAELGLAGYNGKRLSPPSLRVPRPLLRLAPLAALLSPLSCGLFEPIPPPPPSARELAHEMLTALRSEWQDPIELIEALRLHAEGGPAPEHPGPTVDFTRPCASGGTTRIVGDLTWDADNRLWGATFTQTFTECATATVPSYTFNGSPNIATSGAARLDTIVNKLTGGAGFLGTVLYATSERDGRCGVQYQLSLGITFAEVHTVACNYPASSGYWR
jgi:hypothetical protein